MDSQNYNSIDEYIGLFPENIRTLLIQVREVISAACPEAQEKISYQMPTFFLNGNLVHFAAHKSHIGFYPGAGGIEAFKGEFSSYKWSKGAVQFSIAEPIPFELISRIVRYRAEENLSKVRSRK